MKSGIYQIRNQVNGNCYIGSAVNLGRRKRQHFSKLLTGSHENAHLQRSFVKYGNKNFLFTVLEYVLNTNDLILAEQRWIDKYKAQNIALYNNRLIAISNLGLKYPHREETKKKISLKLTGRAITTEHRKNLSKALTGKHPTEETRIRLRLSHLGKRIKDYCVNGHLRISETINRWNACIPCIKIRESKRYEAAVTH